MQSTWNVHLFIYCTTAFKWWAFFFDNKNKGWQPRAAFAHSTFRQAFTNSVGAHKIDKCMCKKKRKKKDHLCNSFPKLRQHEITCSKEAVGADNATVYSKMMLTLPRHLLEAIFSLAVVLSFLNIGTLHTVQHCLGFLLYSNFKFLALGFHTPSRGVYFMGSWTLC